MENVNGSEPIIDQSPNDVVALNLPPKEKTSFNQKVPKNNDQPGEAAAKKTPTPLPKNTIGSAPAGTPLKIVPEQKKRSSGRFIVGCSMGLLVLFILFLILMVLVMAKGGASSPVLKSFGVDSSQVKDFLLNLISVIFGFMGFVSLVILVVGIFKVAMAKKADKIARGSGLKIAFFGFIPLVLVMMAWIGLYAFIIRIEIETERVVAEIIVKDPKDLSHLVAPVEVRFSAENALTALRRGNYAIQAMDWDLDSDGVFETPANQPEVTHIYKTSGNYNVALRVGIQGEKEPRLYTFNLSIPEAVFAADPLQGTPPLAVQFDASNLIEGVKIKSLDWDFENDGTYELQGKEAIKTQFTFPSIGEYKVHLRLVDDRDNVQNFYRSIQVVEGSSPTLSAIIEAMPGLKGSAPINIRFDGSKSISVKGDIIQYEWDFGDGTDLQIGKSISHVFEKGGRYTVRLRIQNEVGQQAEGTVDVTLDSANSAPVAKIKTVPTFEKESQALRGEAPFKVDFDGSVSEDKENDIVAYSWDFDGDGTADFEGQKTNYTFSKPGSYVATLTVTDAQKQTNVAPISIEVLQPGPKVIIEADPVEGAMPLVVNFDASGSTAFMGKIVSYLWDFGDGTPASNTGARITHRFDRVGTYITLLKILTDKNETGQGTQVIYVRDIPLRACFSISRRIGQAPLTVTIDSKCSTGTITQYHFDFGDGKQGNARTTAHTFERAGVYTVTLEVTDDKNNVSTFTDTVTVEGNLK